MYNYPPTYPMSNMPLNAAAGLAGGLAGYYASKPATPLSPYQQKRTIGVNKDLLIKLFKECKTKSSSCNALGKITNIYVITAYGSVEVMIKDGEQPAIHSVFTGDDYGTEVISIQVVNNSNLTQPVVLFGGGKNDATNNYGNSKDIVVSGDLYFEALKNF